MHASVTKVLACVMTKAIMDVYLGRPFNFTVKKFSMADVHMPNHQNAGEVADASEEVVYIRNELFSYKLLQKPLKIAALGIVYL